MKNHKRVFNWQLYFGLILVLTGGVFLADQLLGTGFMVDYWPLLILLLGLTFFVGMLVAGKRGPWLAIPGAVLVTLGLIVFIQNWSNLWITWAYAWALLISAMGLGMLIMNAYLRRQGLRRAAGLIIGIGLILFVFFGVLFEIILDIAGTDVQSGLFLGAGLIFLGFFVVFSRPLFAQRKREQASENQEAEIVDAPFSEPGQVAKKNKGEQRFLPDDANFTNLHFKSVGEVFLLQGEACDLRIEGDPQLISKVNTQWQGDQLKITYAADIADWTGFQWISSENRLRYYVTVKEIHNLHLGGAGVIRADGLTGDNLKVQHAGIGKLTLKGLRYREIEVNLGGLGEIYLEGQVESQVLELGGGGSYHAVDLYSQEADINLSGAGSAQVWVVSTLKASVSGAGNVTYKGDPQVDQIITGLGGVKSR